MSTAVLGLYQLNRWQKRWRVGVGLPRYRPTFGFRKFLVKVRQSLQSFGTTILLVSSVLVFAPALLAQESLLVGVIINNQEVGTLEILQQDDTFLVPLAEFADIAGVRVTTTNGTTQLQTPLGLVPLSDTDLVEINGVVYLSETTIETKLATPIEFDPSVFALNFDLPWRRMETQPSALPEQLVPEVRPPSNTFSTIEQDFTLSRSNDLTTYSSSTVLGGRLFDGSWQVELDNNFQEIPNTTQYFWYRRQGQTQYLVGRQQISLHPLLDGLDLTGVQLASTNQPPSRFLSQRQLGATELLPRQISAFQSFRGTAPPASFVQLRVEGIVVAQQQVGLDGEYEFANIPLPTSQLNQIEVLIFDRSDLTVPAEIRRQILNTSELLLPEGTVVHQAGVGIGGNLVQSFLKPETKETTGILGFYQWRQALSGDYTLEATVQQTAEALQVQGGIVGRLAEPVVVALSGATANGALAYDFDLEVQLPPWQIFATSELLPAAFEEDATTFDRFDHGVEIRYQASSNLSLGLIARSRRDDLETSEFVLPTFAWRPWRNLSFDARPDLAGNYRLSAFYQINPATRVAWRVDETSVVDLSYQINREFALSSSVIYGNEESTSYALTLTRRGLDPRNPTLNLSVGVRDNQLEVGAGASLEVLPGILARVDYQSIPGRTGFGGLTDNRLVLSLTSNFTYDQGSFLPARSSVLGQNRGAIAGRLVVEGTQPTPAFDLSDVEVLVRTPREVFRTTTNAQGSFFLGNLPEGIYPVEIDPAELPFELTPLDLNVVAEIVGGAVTKLNFTLRPEYGFAGRVIDAANQPVANLRIELLNRDGDVIQTTRSDQFGLYRFDSLPAGTYRLRISPRSLPVEVNSPERTVELVDQFLFGQDLQLQTPLK